MAVSDNLVYFNAFGRKIFRYSINNCRIYAILRLKILVRCCIGPSDGHLFKTLLFNFHRHFNLLEIWVG